MEISEDQTHTTLDWINLIEEAQTDPEGLSGKAVQELYYEIYWYINSLSENWLATRKLSETEDGLLLDIGIEKILKELEKFECRSDDAEIVRLQFFAWMGTICERHWSKSMEKMAKGNSAYQAHVETVWDTDTDDEDRVLLRSPEEKARLQAIMEKCLGKYTENMRQAILATMGLKESVSSKKRGRTGEAALICKHYGVNPSTVRGYTKRVIDCAREAYAQEGK